MSTTIKNAVNNLNKAIIATMPIGSYMTLEIGSGLDGIKTITASISSGAYSKTIDHCAITGVITSSHHELKDFYNAMSIKREVLIAFRELMFSVNALLTDDYLTNMRFKNNLTAFNAVIKPWSIQVTHLCETDLVTASRMKDSPNIMLSSNNTDKLGGFTTGGGRNEQERAYETFLNALLSVAPEHCFDTAICQPELVYS